MSYFKSVPSNIVIFYDILNVLMFVYGFYWKLTFYFFIFSLFQFTTTTYTTKNVI